MKKLMTLLFIIIFSSLICSCVKEHETIIDKDVIDISSGEEILNEEIQVDIDKYEVISYKDDEYGFSLEIPQTWEGKYFIEKGIWIDGINHSVAFNYFNNGISNNIFTIIIMEEVIFIEDWDEYFLIYIDTKDGKTYSYLNIMEPTEELLEEGNKEALAFVTEMVEGVPAIIETIKLNE